MKVFKIEVNLETKTGYHIGLNSIILDAFRNNDLLINHWIKSELTALDLGCRVPTTSFYLHHHFKLNKYVAIDIEDELACVESFKDTLENEEEMIAFRDARTFFDIYRIGIDAENPIPSLEEFNNIFRWFQKKDAREYLKECDEKFDIIIASNLLHFLPSDEEEMIKRMVSLLKPNGILYILVKVKEDYGYLNGSSIKKVLLTNFETGTLIEGYDRHFWEYTEFISFEPMSLEGLYKEITE